MKEPVTIAVSYDDKTDFNTWIIDFPHITIHRSPLLNDGQTFVITEETIQARMKEVLALYDLPQ